MANKYQHALLFLAVPMLAWANQPMPDAVWHLQTRCVAGDVNDIFQYRGTWHLMHQWGTTFRTSIGHLVSKDLLHWTRIQDALVSGPAADEECYDGSMSFVERGGVNQPVLMIDGGCGFKVTGNGSCMETHGDEIGGVVGFPANLSDPYLANWTRIGPTRFQGCDGSAGPSRIWKNGDKYNLIAIHRPGEARFEATDDSLTNWKMVDPAFVKRSAGGGGVWHELPPNLDGTTGDRWPTHIFDAGSDPSFVLGVYDPAHETFTNVTDPQPVDIGWGVAYGQVSQSDAGGDKRALHISWLVQNCTNLNGVMTSFRDLRFDPRLGRLVQNPIEEYLSLRSDVLFKKAVRLEAGVGAQLLHTGEGGAIMDTEVDISVPVGAQRTVVHIGARCSNEGCVDGVRMTFTITSPRANASAWRSPLVRREVTMAVSIPGRLRQTTFPLLSDEMSLPVRIMSDRRTVEIFAAAGRGVYTGSLFTPAGQIFAASEHGDVQLNATGWAIKSIGQGHKPLGMEPANLNPAMPPASEDVVVVV